MAMWREINAIIRKKQRFVVTTHVNPDGDGIGAACALIELLLMQDKEVRLVCDSPIPEKFHFLDFHSVFESYGPETDLSDTEVLIVLDTHRRERIGALANLLDRDDVISICIDHHRPSETFAQHIAIDAESCAVGAMVYTLFKASGYPLNREAAMGIYASIICDTGRFCYGSTSRKAHKIADECIKLGVDPSYMHSQLFQQLSITEAKSFANALQSMESYYDNRVLLFSLRAKDYEGEELNLAHMDLEYVHEYGKSLKEVECVALLREVSPCSVRLSLRSKGPFDVLQIAKVLGGGGHEKAAGANLPVSLSDAKSQVLNLLQPHFARGHACVKAALSPTMSTSK